MELLKTGTYYQMNVPEKTFNQIRIKDGYCKKGLELYNMIEKVEGVIRGSVDYDGHLGACIYFSVEIDQDNEKTHHKIRELITTQAKQ